MVLKRLVGLASIITVLVLSEEGHSKVSKDKSYGSTATDRLMSTIGREAKKLNDSVKPHIKQK